MVVVATIPVTVACTATSCCVRAGDSEGLMKWFSYKIQYISGVSSSNRNYCLPFASLALTSANWKERLSLNELSSSNFRLRSDAT